MVQATCTQAVNFLRPKASLTNNLCPIPFFVFIAFHRYKTQIQLTVASFPGFCVRAQKRNNCLHTYESHRVCGKFEIL